MVIYLGCQLPDTSSDHTRERSGPLHKLLYLVLLQVGFTGPGSHHPAGKLLPYLSTLTRYHRKENTGRYISVALSLRSPSLGITQHLALWSSDFPRTQSVRDHLTYSFMYVLFYVKSVTFYSF